MLPLQHARDPHHLDHLEEARRVLALPPDASGFHWHPFGVFAIPLPRRVDGDRVWVRRLHVWHPETTPVGETSIYGVHTHSGTAKSHVVVGTLTHHLYSFRPDADGTWRECAKGVARMAALVAHVEGPTHEGTTHTLPRDHPHGVSKPPGLAISLFEQLEEGRAQPFTTWQRTDAPAEALVTQAPVEPGRALKEARAIVEEILYALR